MSDNLKDHPDAKALDEAVATAKDRLGPLAVASMLDKHAHDARQEAKSGEYPRAMYNANGETRSVLSKADEEALGKDWSRTPSDIHRNVVSRDSVAGTTEEIEAELSLRRRRRRRNTAEVSETLENQTPDVPRTTIVGNTTIEHSPQGDDTMRPPAPDNS